MDLFTLVAHVSSECPRTLDALQPFAQRGIKDALIALCDGANASWFAARLCNGEFPDADLLMGFLAAEDCTFTVRFASAVTKSFKLRRGEWVDAFHGTWMPLLLGLVKFTLHDVSGLVHGVYAVLDMAPRRQLQYATTYGLLLPSGYSIRNGLLERHGVLLYVPTKRELDESVARAAAKVKQAEAHVRAVHGVGAATEAACSSRTPASVLAAFKAWEALPFAVRAAAAVGAPRLMPDCHAVASPWRDGRKYYVHAPTRTVVSCIKGGAWAVNEPGSPNEAAVLQLFDARGAAPRFAGVGPGGGYKRVSDPGDWQ